MDTKQKLKLRKFVNELKQIRGRHTELISVYVPAGYDIIKIIQHLEQEQGTASNIKDKNNRKNVIDSLERLIRHLRLFKQTPENGLAVFSGNISDNPSKIDIQVFSIEPPEPVNIRLYRCDHVFKFDILEEMLDVADIYGLIVMDNRDGSVGTLKGTRVELLKELHSAVPGKIKAGGQCLDPETIISMADGQFIRLDEVEVGDGVLSFDFKEKRLVSSKVLKKWETKKEIIYTIISEKDSLICSADHLLFVEDGTTKLAETITVHDFLLNEKGNPVKVREVLSDFTGMELIDLEVENKNFIANGVMVHNSQQRFARLREIAAHEFYIRIGDVANKELGEIKGLKGILVGGPGTTKDKFVSGNYLHTDLKNKVLTLKDLSYTGEFGLQELVEKCQEELAKEEIIKEIKLVQEFLLLLKTDQRRVTYGLEKTRKALEMGAVDKLLVSENVENIEELETIADQMGSKVFVIGTETQEGQQLKNIGGIAAILRYELEL